MSVSNGDADKLIHQIGRLSPLSVSQKLTCAFILFLAPLGYVIAELTEQQQKAIDFADKERQGLRYLSLVSEAEDELREHARERAQAPAHEHVEAARGLIDTAETEFGAGIGAAGSYREASAQLKALAIGERAGAEDLAAAQEALKALRRDVGDGSNLILDPDLDSYYAMDVVLMKSPALRENLQALGRISRAVSEDGRVTLSERTRVTTALGFVEDALRQVDISIASGVRGARDERLERAISQFHRKAQVYVNEMVGEVDRALMSPRGSLIGVSASESTALLAVSSLSGAMSGELDRLLRERVERFENERFVALLVAAGLFLAALAMTVLFLRRGVLQPLQVLTGSIRTLSAGEFDKSVPLQGRGDEIGEIARAVEVLRDLARSKIDADAARAAAESANVAKSNFLASMSHELRTPLNAIIGYAELLHEDAVESGQQHTVADLERILAAGRHLLGLINDVLDLAKVEAGRIDLRIEAVSPAALIAEVVAAAQPLAAKNGNSITVEVAQAAGPIQSDALRLRQCLYNLVSNACKFTRNGQIEIRAQIRGVADRQMLAVTVHDTGIGISAQQIARLFKPFSQADESITREFGGTGLGLLLTRHMARELGGDVALESVAGVGSVFTLTVADMVEAQTSSVGRDGALVDAPGVRRVLVIDDEDSARDLVMRVLRPLGFEVKGARTAAEGVAMANAEAPHVILLDVHLPDRSGWDTLATLRQLPTVRETPVIVLSVDEDRRTSLSLGAAEHLVKPVQRDVLAATVLRFVRIEEVAGNAAAPSPGAGEAAPDGAAVRFG